MLTPHALASLYSRAHNLMRNTDGLLPQEAFDELLKYLFFKEMNEVHGPMLEDALVSPSDRLFFDDHEEMARAIKDLLPRYLEDADSWSSQLWRDKQFHLSDQTLGTLHRLLQGVTLSRIPFDIRSAAIKEFLPAEIRRGLGIYLTPDDVVRTMVEFVAPDSGQVVYDPACGSGTFLIETLKRWSEKRDERTVWGADINPRMLLLADLNLGHYKDVVFRRRLADFLSDPGLDGLAEEWIEPGTVDHIFTNPPFGVVLTNSTHDLSRFDTCKTAAGGVVGKQQSEVAFIEQALKMLRLGGTLAIIVPKSVLTNTRLRDARRVLDKLGYVYAVVTFPPETFHTVGTQTTTMALFIRRYLEEESHNEQLRIGVVNVSNVGYDSTGRTRSGNQLPTVAAALRASLASGTEVGACKLLPAVSKGDTFSALANLLSGKTSTSNSTKLGDVVELVCTGKTPARSSYTDEGLFVVKVGNLTGRGIDWSPRERNFISRPPEPVRKGGHKNLLLQEGDILLTSSAHSPAYIAKKVDIVTTVPPWVGGAASFVGEVMLLRPRHEVVDSFVLLAYLRLPKTSENIRLMVRGQTAHLHTKDMLDLPIPNSVLQPTDQLRALADLLRREAALNEETNLVAHELRRLLEEHS